VVTLPIEVRRTAPLNVRHLRIQYLPKSPRIWHQALIPLERPKRRTREGGSEWEPIKILSQKNSAYIPIATPSHTQTSGSTHKPPLKPYEQSLKRLGNKVEANTKELEQSTKKAETYRVNRHK
jgi:hypothetical protein